MSKRAREKSMARSFSVAFAAAALVAVPACGIETQGLGPNPPPDTSTTPTAGSGGTDDPPVTTPAGPTPDPPDGGANQSDGSAQGHVDSGPPTGEACDGDHDSHLAVACGGDDCCDTDANVHPGVTAYFDTKNACNGFDYDCNGAEAFEFQLAVCKAGFLACSGDGFAVETPCGLRAEFTTCSWSAFACAEGKTLQTQRCH